MVRYLHIRRDGEYHLDGCRFDVGTVANRGGATIAYTELDGCLCLAPAWCSDSDNFDRSVGRKIAAERLKTDGPWDIIEAEHPRTAAVVKWAELNLYDSPVKISSIGKHWVILE